MSAPTKEQQREANRTSGEWVQPVFRAVTGLVVGGTAVVETTGGATIWVWFIHKAVLGS